MSFKIFMYDDAPSRKSLIENASLKYTNDIQLSVKIVNTDKLLQESIEEINTLTGDFALLLDLNLNRTDQIWKCVINKIKAVLSECRFTADNDLEFPYEGNWCKVSNFGLDGMCLLLAVLENKSPGKTLIIMYSSLIQHKTISRFVKYISAKVINSTRTIILDKDEEGNDADDQDSASELLKTTITKWNAAFPLYHVDSFINNSVIKFIEFYRDLEKSGNALRFCQHGTSETSTIQGSPEEYKKLITEIFALNDTQLIPDTNGSKALLMLAKEPSDKISPNLFFEEWKSEDIAPGWDMIAGKNINAILGKIFDMNVKVMAPEVQLPCCPALPFLLSLRELVFQLKSQVGGSILDTSNNVVLTGSNEMGYHRLSIPLINNKDMVFGVAKTWIRKCLPDSPETGVCLGIWNAMMAKVSIAKGVAADNTENVLLGLFDGLDRPIVGVTFDPHGINLHWR